MEQLIVSVKLQTSTAPKGRSKRESQAPRSDKKQGEEPNLVRQSLRLKSAREMTLQRSSLSDKSRLSKSHKLREQAFKERPLSILMKQKPFKLKRTLVSWVMFMIHLAIWSMTRITSVRRSLKCRPEAPLDQRAQKFQRCRKRKGVFLLSVNRAHN